MTDRENDFRFTFHNPDMQQCQTFSKQEYIHLHGLFGQISSYVEKEHQELYEQVDLSRYEELGVNPTSIHKNKSDHREAVEELSSSLAEACEALEP